MLADAVGLGVFTVAGIKTAIDITPEPNAFLFIFVGVITGVGGGILRDVLSGSKPYIFIKHVYGCASIAGAVICVCLFPVLGANPAMLTGALAAVIIRLLAFRFKWDLPYADISEHSA